MTLSPDLVERLLELPAAEAWRLAGDHAWATCSAPLPLSGEGDVEAAVVARDRALAGLDLLLAGAAWDLWEGLEACVPACAASLRAWWAAHPPGRAVLILDGLSLREVPWLLGQAEARGLKIREAGWRRAEVPGDTDSFAAALGAPGRSSLQNDGAGKSFALRPARTECTDLPFQDCAAQVGAEPDLVLWHRWPDDSVHLLSPAGKGLPHLAREARARLTDEGFWALVRRLAEGRRLVVTSDHGYAATGLFELAPDDQGQYLQSHFKSGRHGQGGGEPGPWLPPAEVVRDPHRLALGRRRWRSPGGYPTLAHGGLTVLEMLVPYLEMERVP